MTASNAVCGEKMTKGEILLITGSNRLQKKLGRTEFGLRVIFSLVHTEKSQKLL